MCFSLIFSVFRSGVGFVLITCPLLLALDQSDLSVQMGGAFVPYFLLFMLFWVVFCFYYFLFGVLGIGCQTEAAMLDDLVQEGGVS